MPCYQAVQDEEASDRGARRAHVCQVVRIDGECRGRSCELAPGRGDIGPPMGDGRERGVARHVVGCLRGS